MMDQSDKIPKFMADKLLFQDAIKKWGTLAQIDMMIEECGELIVALNHHKRGRADDGDVAEELADVQIMLNQMKIIFDETDTKYDQKMERLRKKLE